MSSPPRSTPPTSALHAPPPATTVTAIASDRGYDDPQLRFPPAIGGRRPRGCARRRIPRNRDIASYMDGRFWRAAHVDVEAVVHHLREAAATQLERPPAPQDLSRSLPLSRMMETIARVLRMGYEKTN